MDFLTFKSFISTEVLIVFYYLGAVVLPVGMWFVMLWLLHRYELFNTAYTTGKAIIWQSLTRKQKTYLLVSFVTLFLFMQLFWRMLFEFLIAYMQIRDALTT